MLIWDNIFLNVDNFEIYMNDLVVGHCRNYAPRPVTLPEVSGYKKWKAEEIVRYANDKLLVNQKLKPAGRKWLAFVAISVLVLAHAYVFGKRV